jgi:hypothetical protein
LIVKPIIITNNKISKEYYEQKYEVIFVEGSLMDVLIAVRDQIHKGHELLTHPLSGSVKPNETPYKSVAITYASQEQVDLKSLMLIENSIETARKLLVNKTTKVWPESVLEDFRVIDFDLIKNAVN